MDPEITEKLKAVRRELEGLDVKYQSHHASGEQVSQALVNGYSVIWHKYAYCYGEPYTVEVMKPDGNVEGHVPIDNLRKLVTEGKL